jgi:hypothetical protein
VSASQNRAVAAHRHRLRERGLARYEVVGPERDKELIRKLARRLGQDDPVAARLRTELAQQVAEGEPRRRGGILAALRASPLVGLDLDFEREVVPERDVEI